MTSDSVSRTLHLADEAATIAVGSALALAFIESRAQTPTAKLCLHLHGDLGAGKSTLARALLRGLGVTGKIKSPTYALVEPYDSDYGLLLHMDSTSRWTVGRAATNCGHR